MGTVVLLFGLCKEKSRVIINADKAIIKKTVCAAWGGAAVFFVDKRTG